MVLDEIVKAQKRGEARGIPSICSVHPNVIRQTLRVSQTFKTPPLIEATCNQVNQYGGYMGMNPAQFVEYVRGIADELGYPFGDIILGGDHLGPHGWQNEAAELAMQKARELVRAYVEAGFVKIHLDCSMRLADDQEGDLDPEIMAGRVAELAGITEEVRGDSALRYVIGAEVPLPGGATEQEGCVRVTKAEDVRQTLQVTREAFFRAGLESAWERVMAVVVQPGMEYGDDFILPYRSEAAMALSAFIEDQPMIYEAHSTDYQTGEALGELVRDHFAILKVGPALTFAFREAVFTLAMIEKEMIEERRCSNIIHALDHAMLAQPGYWKNYYPGSQGEQAYKRKYSLSDRARYYWMCPEVNHALAVLIRNLGETVLPYSLLSQYVGETGLNAGQVIERKINRVLENYLTACDATLREGVPGISR